MPYDQGHAPPSYGNYGAYGQQAPPGQTQYPQHPMVVIPQQPRHVVPQASPYLPTSPHPYATQSGHYQQMPPQYSQGYQPPYPPEQSQHALAEFLQQSPYQHQRYYQPQAIQHASSQGYYQAPNRQASISDTQSLRQPPAQQYPRPQHRSTPQQSVSSRAGPSPNVFSAPPVQYAHQTTRTPSQQAPAPQGSQQRSVAHVQIPAQRSAVAPTEVDMPREAKRRRSNEGIAVAVHDAPMPIPQKSSASQRVKQVPMTSSPLTELASSQLPPTPPPNVDYQAVLLSLADEYVTAAYGMSASLAGTDGITDQLEQYHGYMSLAMGCLESVLKNYRQSDARKEARIRLRLATLLHDETENLEETQEVLSKGIALCERNKLRDLKYAMHHLSVRVVSKTSPKAAMKAIEKLVAEVEALRLPHWMYAFRFLRVSLGLQASGHSDSSAVLKNLTAISATAESLRHVAVQIVSSTLEAMVHLQSSAPDSLELAQRALAAARTHQLGEEMQRLPQLRAMLDCLDVTCAILQFSPDQIAMKLQHMHDNIDAATKDAGWNKDGSFIVPMGVPADDALLHDTGGVMRSSEGDEAVLTFSWLTNGQLYALGYLLSGLATMHKDVLEHRTDSYLDAGSKLCQASISTSLQSLAAATARTDWQASLSVTLRIQQAFAYCGRSEFTQALQSLREPNKVLAHAHQPTDETSKANLIYLEAVCKHALGDLKAALALYSSSELDFKAGSREVNGMRDMQALATLNSILILREQSNEQQANALHAKIEPYCLTRSNKALVGAYYLIKATAEANSAIIKRKQYLQSAVQAGQMSKNQQVLCVILNCMTDMFFRNIVGDQAVKSAAAGRSLAMKCHNPLWIAVSNRMYGNTAELCGDHERAARARMEAVNAMQALSPELQKKFLV